jgi:SAM-dependent methyltransferase
MHWKLKSAIQNAIALLPSSVSYSSYYWMQRRFGNLRTVRPWPLVAAAVAIWKLIVEQGRDPRGKVFLEVGTGRTVIVPTCYWLMGASKTVTVDLNPYLRPELIIESVKTIAGSRDRVEESFGALLDAQRFDELVALSQRSNVSMEDVLKLCGIEYHAPADARQTGFLANSIDFHASYTVFEHIPYDILVAILREGNRLMRKDGLLVHSVDYTDHFSHSDRRISAVNFLRYSDRAWSLYAGNKYMYTNRLRHDDFEQLFQAAGLRVVATKRTIDPRVTALLQSGSFQLDERFSAKSRETLEIASAWFVAEAKHDLTHA